MNGVDFRRPNMLNRWATQRPVPAWDLLRGWALGASVDCLACRCTRLLSLWIVITLHTTRSTHAHIASLGRSGHPVAAAAAAKAGRQPASHDGLRANPTTAYYYGTTYLYIHIIYIPTLYMPI